MDINALLTLLALGTLVIAGAATHAGKREVEKEIDDDETLTLAADAPSQL